MRISFIRTNSKRERIFYTSVGKCEFGDARLIKFAKTLLWGGARKQTSLHTTETAMPPFFSAAKSNFKGTMVLLRSCASDLGHIGLKIYYARNAVNESNLRERFDYIVTDSHSRDFEDIFLPGLCGQHNHWHSA